MLFNSLSFLVFFFIVIFLFARLRERQRVYLLVFASCYFYCQFVPEYLLILFLVIAVDYFSGLAIEKATREGLEKSKRTFFILSLASNLSILFFFKYFNFFNENLSNLANFFGWSYGLKSLSFLLPIGLSFHVFQSLSYTIEVYQGRQKAEKDFAIFALYVLYFPQLVAGPIERPQNLLHQFKTMEVPKIQTLKEGLFLIFTGLVKKCVVADNLSILCDRVYSSPYDFGFFAHLLGTLFFAFQIYGDFSGYSDIARGCSKFFGIELILNFNKPYLAKTVSEFWRRWHISLSTWFRDYVYFPLGGNRGPVRSTVINTFVVFILSGLWHGANWTFVAWGVFHGAVVGMEHFLKKTDSRVWTLSLVLLGWVFFRASHIQDVFDIFTSPFFRSPTLGLNLLNPMIAIEGLVIIAGLVFFEVRFSYIDEGALAQKLASGKKEFWSELGQRKPFFRWLVYACLAVAFMLFAQLNKQQFIYFQF